MPSYHFRQVICQNKPGVGINRHTGNFIVINNSLLYQGLYQINIKLAAYNSDCLVKTLINNGNHDSYTPGVFSLIFKDGGVGHFNYFTVGAVHMRHCFLNNVADCFLYIPVFPCQSKCELSRFGRACPAYETAVHAVNGVGLPNGNHADKFGHILKNSLYRIFIFLTPYRRSNVFIKIHYIRYGL